MFLLVKQLCSVSLLCSALMAIAPEGGVKKIMNIICTLILAGMVIAPLTNFDFNVYSFELASYKEREREFLNSSKDLDKNLSRPVIERYYEEYIMDKATEIGLDVKEINVQMRWDSEGIWLPESVELKHGYSSALSEYIEAELGVPENRQQWVTDYGN